MFKYLNVKMSKGFTLIELMVVVSIIVILSLMIIPNYQSFQKDLALQRAATELAQDIRRAQEMAMANTLAEDCFNEDGTEKHPDDYEYGFSIELKTAAGGVYVLFADCNGSYRYEPGQDEDMILLLADLNSVEIDSLYIPGYTGIQKIYITFSSPDPIVTFWGVPPTMVVNVSSISIRLRVKNDPTKTKTITVNKAGLITVE